MLCKEKLHCLLSRIIVKLQGLAFLVFGEMLWYLKLRGELIYGGQSPLHTGIDKGRTHTHTQQCR